MKKVISVRPINELELQFEDGKSLTLKFDVQALYNFTNVDGGLTDFIKEKSIPEMCAKIIHVAGASHNQGLTLDKAREITSNLDPMTITEILNEFNLSVGTGKNEVQSELQKKLMEKFLANWM